MKRPTIIAGGLIGLLLLGLIVWLTASEEDPVNQKTAEARRDPENTHLPDVQDDEPLSAEPMQDSVNARLLRFDGVAGTMDVRVGGPGLDAAFEATVIGGLMPIPVRYEGNEVPTMEVRAISTEGCFWGDVKGDQERVSVVPGSRLRVKLVDPIGRNISGAEVRVGREFLSFLFEEGESNDDGIFSVECVPEGDYAVSITAPGFVVEHIRTRVPGDLELTLTRGYRVDGYVRNEKGEAVDQAILLIASCLEDLCVPESIVASSINGAFVTDGLRTDSIKVLARHPDYETIEVRTDAGSPVVVQLVAAKNRTFRAMDAQRRPVADAIIEWESRVDRGRGVSDANGEWKDRGVPLGARARASLGNFVSSWVEVQGPEVRLNVEARARDLLLRVNAPEEVVDVSVTLVADSQKCPLDRLNPSDFRLRCEEGSARFSIDMGRGIYATVTDLKNGTTLSVPPAKIHTLWVESLETPSAEIDFGSGWQPLGLVKSNDKEWKATFSFWGDTHKVRLRAARMGERVVTLKQSETRVELRPVQSHRLWVLDGQGSPITGAWIGIVDSSGVRQRWATSSGQLPFERRIEKEETLNLFVVDPRRGAGAISLGEGDTERRIELRRPVLESPPATYIGLDAAQSLIGAPLLRDGSSYRIDEMNTEAQKAGVPRGAWWVAGWKESAGTRVVLWNGKSYTEHTIKGD